MDVVNLPLNLLESFRSLRFIFGTVEQSAWNASAQELGADLQFVLHQLLLGASNPFSTWTPDLPLLPSHSLNGSHISLKSTIPPVVAMLLLLNHLQLYLSSFLRKRIITRQCSVMNQDEPSRTV